MPLPRPSREGFAVANTGEDEGQLRQHDAFRESGRAAGIKDNGRIAGPRLGEAAVIGRRNEPGEIAEACASTDRVDLDAAQRWRIEGFKPPRRFSLDDEDARPRVVQGIGKVLPDEAGIEGREDRADARRGKQQQKFFDAIEKQGRDAVALTDTTGDQCSAQLARSLFECGIAETRAADIDEGLVAVLAGLVDEKCVNRRPRNGAFAHLHAEASGPMRAPWTKRRGKTFKSSRAARSSSSRKSGWAIEISA